MTAEIESLISAAEALALSAGRGKGSVKLLYSSASNFRPGAPLLLMGENAAGDESAHERESDARGRDDYSAYLDESWRGTLPGRDFRQLRTQAIAMVLVGHSAREAIDHLGGRKDLPMNAEGLLRRTPATQLFPFRSRNVDELRERWPSLYTEGRKIGMAVAAAVRPRMLVSLGSGRESPWRALVNAYSGRVEVDLRVSNNNASYRRAELASPWGQLTLVAVSHLTRPWHENVLVEMANDRHAIQAALTDAGLTI